MPINPALVNRTMKSLKSDKWLTASRCLQGAILALPFWLSASAHASFFQGETLDAVADGAAWVVLIIAPIIGIGVFLLVHILPEKIAEKKKHPQAQAIQTLCILSLFFGGMLWPLAWLWAYSKPVLYKMAYGKDTAEHGAEGETQPSVAHDAANELRQLRKRIDELESSLGSPSSVKAGKA